MKSFSYFLVMVTGISFISFNGIYINAQKLMSDLPVFGAQVFIEPGQTSGDIDTWFRMLKENE